MTIIPRPLKKWDSVAIIAPSWSMTVMNQQILRNIENYFWGFWINVIYGKSAQKDHFWSGGTIKERIIDIMDGFKNPKIWAIIPIFWWFTANHLLPYLDYNLIKNNPKIFIWYSDITALNIAIWSKTGLATYLWPWWTQLWHYFADEYTLHGFEKMVFSENKQVKFSPSQYRRQGIRWLNDKKDSRTPIKNDWWHVVNKGKSNGTSFWWNLSTLALLVGTEYLKIPKDPIIFLEECWDLTEWWIIRFLEQMYQIGLFRKAKGIVLWRFENSSKIHYEYLIENLTRYVKNDIPIVLNADFWHTEPMMTIPIGVKTTLNTSQRIISFTL